MQVGDKVLWRSFKIIDRWYEGVIARIVKKKRSTEYHISTSKGGIHSVIVRYEGDIKPNF
jgi:hypothetical protein